MLRAGCVMSSSILMRSDVGVIALCCPTVRPPERSAKRPRCVSSLRQVGAQTCIAPYECPAEVSRIVREVLCERGIPIMSGLPRMKGICLVYAGSGIR